MWLLFVLALVLAAVTALRSATKQATYAQGLIQAGVANFAGGMATAACGCFALAAIGIPGEKLSYLGGFLTIFQGMVTAMASRTAQVSPILPCQIAIIATLTYSLVVVGFIIAADVAAQEGR